MAPSFAGHGNARPRAWASKALLLRFGGQMLEKNANVKGILCRFSPN